MARSHNKPVIIRPMQVKLVKPDGATYNGEELPLSCIRPESALITGDAAADISAANAAQSRSKDDEGYCLIPGLVAGDYMVETLRYAAQFSFFGRRALLLLHTRRHQRAC